MTDIHELLSKIYITPKLIYYINNLYKRMINQLRFSLGRLNGITTVEVNRLFNLTELEPEDLKNFMELYPKDVFVMRQPIYNLLTLITIKAIQEGNKQLALDTNTLLGMVFLGKLKYHYIRIIDQEILEKSISQMSKKSYVGLHGVVWMINYVTKSTFDRWMPLIMKDITEMYPRYRYIIDLRNKLNQIMKTIAHQYYYNILHRNDVDKAVVIKKRANEILDYITTKLIPSNIFELAAKLCKSDPNKLAKLHYNIQSYPSMQGSISLLINNILERLFNTMEIYKLETGKNIDINDLDWLKLFFVGLKRSTIILQTASSPIFGTYEYDRFEVIAYTLVVTLFVDSLNHNNDYYSISSSNNSQDLTTQYNYYDDESLSNSRYNGGFSLDENYINDSDEQLEALFEGFQYDKELFELYRGDE